MNAAVARVRKVAGHAVRKIKRLGYKWPFRWTRVRARIAHRLAAIEAPRCDLLFVFHPLGASGWILEGICREIERHSGLVCEYFKPVTCDQRGIPSARAYFFVDYPVFPDLLARNPVLSLRPTFLYFWHPLDFGSEEARVLYAFSKASKIVTMCSLHTDWLANRGLDRANLRMIVGGADEAVFRPHRRGEGAIGFSTACYPRKAPERVHAIVESMPHRRFILLGRRWEQYERFEDLSRLPNLTILQDVPYDQYPAHYAEMDVFVSASYQEGGPIPLLETMMCDIVPVVSRTGFAPDIVKHGSNGFLFDTDAPVADVCELIEQALRLKGSVRNSVLSFSWREFTSQLVSMLPAELQEKATLE
jgi:glycosyltransferase involved in cell wall biosynthesis